MRLPVGTICFIILSIPQIGCKKPNIIVIIADDLGRNDVSFHGSNQIPTPNIDALAYNGIILERFYTQSTCTPSRTAFLTGNYPLRSGMHGYPLKGGENRAIPLNMTIMPEHLKRLGYETHLVGKWHLGAAYRNSTPTGRGFDSHFGYWNGFIGYFDHHSFTYLQNGTKSSGLDLHDGLKPVWDSHNQYATDLFTQKSVEIINNHNIEKPLFLVVSHLAPHTGKNGTELAVPDSTITEKFAYIKNPRRRIYASVVTLLDQSIGQIISQLSKKSMLDNSIVLFFSDNGAQTVGMYENAGSNWPLRGVKFSDFEGGVRTAAAIFSPLFPKRGYVSNALIHLSDWLPTFYAAAGGDLTDLGKIDGINQWTTLTKNQPTNRTEILINIDEVKNTSAFINANFKYLKGTFENGFYDKYYGDSGTDPEVPSYNIDEILQSSTNQAIQNCTGSSTNSQQIQKLRSEIGLSWCRKDSTDLDCRNGCLFDLNIDPCETTNILESKKEIADGIVDKIKKFTNEMVLQTNKLVDYNSNPVFYNNTWCTWLEDDYCFKTKEL